MSPADRPDAHPDPAKAPARTDLGTHAWVTRTGGRLTAAERRSLLRPLARTHAANAAGRLSMLLRVNAGRRAVTTGRRPLPDSVLTRAAEDVARRRLSPALLGHSYRTYAFGVALGELENLDVDREVLFAAALLHDVGLPTPCRRSTSRWPAPASPATSPSRSGCPPPRRTR